MKYEIRGDQKYLAGSSIHNDATACEMELWKKLEVATKALERVSSLLQTSGIDEVHNYINEALEKINGDKEK